MQAILQFLITVFVVPAILLMLLYLAIQIALVRGSELSTTSRSLALLFGFGIFVLFVVLNLNSDLLPSSKLASYSRAINDPPLYIIGGFIIGLIIMALIDLLITARAVAFLIIVLTSTSLIALYLYIFIADSRSPLLQSTVSLLLGVLLYGVVRPRPFVSLKLRATLARFFKRLFDILRGRL